MNDVSKPTVGIIMGSDSDLDVMSKAAQMLDEFDVSYEVRVTSAHRTPEWMMEYAKSAESRGVQIIIAGAGGSAHLPGMTASETTLPVIAVPVKREHHGNEALMSSIAMPRGIPLAVVPNNAADRAALYAVRILSLSDKVLGAKYKSYIQGMNEDVLRKDQKLQDVGWKEYLGNQ